MSSPALTMLSRCPLAGAGGVLLSSSSVLRVAVHSACKSSLSDVLPTLATVFEKQMLFNFDKSGLLIISYLWTVGVLFLLRNHCLTQDPKDFLLRVLAAVCPGAICLESRPFSVALTLPLCLDVCSSVPGLCLRAVDPHVSVLTLVPCFLK